MLQYLCVCLHQASFSNRQCISCIIPDRLKRQTFFLYFISNSQISITCFGFRPDHMVSYVKLTTKNSITKTLAYKIHFLWKLHFHFLPEKVKLCPHKTGKVQKRPPLRGVVLPLPVDMLPLSSLFLLIIISFAKRNVVTDQATKVSLSLLLLPPPLPQRPQRNKSSRLPCF